VPIFSHKRSPLLPSAILALPLLAAHCLAQTTPAEPQTSSSEATLYRIAGHIVSATDGHPLQRATVQILRTKTYKLEASTIAGEDGSFAFTNLKPGGYVLEGSLTGYITSRYDAHGGYSTAIITAAGVDTESLVLKLTPDADLSGRITDEAGDPVRRATIALYRESSETGAVRITRSRNAQTDDTGAYDLAHLAPGRYFLSATATPWYAIHPQLTPQASQIGIVDALDPSLDMAYPLTFYPDAMDSSAASPIPLKGGDQLELDMRLTPQPAVTITVPRTPEQRDNNLQFQRKVFDDLEQVNVEMRGSATVSSFVGLPPGQYVMKQMHPQSGVATGSTTINLTERGTQIDPPQAEELANLKLLLKTSDGTQLPPQTTVALVPRDGRQTGAQPLNEKGETEVKEVAPGEYYFVVSLPNKPYFVTSLIANGKTLPGNNLRVTAGATMSVTVIASTATASIEGFAKDGATPAPGALILLLPADESSRARLDRAKYVWRDQSDLDGSFHLVNIPPGRYILMAIQDGWDLEWQREDVLAHYLPLGTPVTIPATGNASLKLPGPLPVQPR